jgi:hypothetical protein
MTALPHSIKHIFFKTMSAQVELADFEQWIYTSKELEQGLHEDAYLELLSFSYKKRGARYELFKLLHSLIDAGEYETWKLTLLLNEAKVRNIHLPGVLERFYDLYCNGYYFLNHLGFGFGLYMCVLPAPYKVEHWSELNEAEIMQLVNKLPPALDDELNIVLQWLENGKIVLTGKQDQYNHYKFIDNRTAIEKTRMPQFNL